MKSPRVQALAEGIKNRLIGIQKSQQIYKDLSRVDKKNLRITEQQIEAIANGIATTIDNWFIFRNHQGNPPAPHEITKRIEDELKNFSE